MAKLNEDEMKVLKRQILVSELNDMSRDDERQQLLQGLQNFDTASKFKSIAIVVFVLFVFILWVKL